MVLGFFPSGVSSDGACAWQMASMFRQGVKKVGMKQKMKTMRGKKLSVGFIFKNM